MWRNSSAAPGLLGTSRPDLNAFMIFMLCNKITATSRASGFDSADERGMAMAFTGARHFRH